MKWFRCGDVIPGCHVEFVGDEPTILHEVAGHARRDHGVGELTDETVTAVREAIRPGPRAP